MATGSGQLGVNSRGIETTNIRPQISVPSTSELYGTLAKIGAKLDAVAGEAFDKRAAAKGARDGMEAAKKTGVGDHVNEPDWWMSAARKSAFDASYRAGVRIDIDSRLEQAKRDHAYDPEGFKATADKIVSGFIQGAPGDYAVEVEQYAQGKVASAFDVVARMRQTKDQQEAVNTLGAREAQLKDDILARAALPGGIDSPEFAMAVVEFDGIQREKIANPLFAYTPEQAAIARENLDDTINGVRISTLAVEKYGAGGKGMAGRLEAMRFLEGEILNGEAYADVPQTKRIQYYNAAKKNVDAIYANDKIASDLEDEREREAARTRREIVGDYRLKIVTGEVDETTIKADPTLDDGQKATLIASARAQARREAADARRDAALGTALQAATYRQYSDRAAAGTLSAEDLADARDEGLSPGQIRTLSAKRDRVLKPVIDGVMAPLRDGLKGAGMGTMRGQNVLIARAEEEAAVWARMNPNAPLDEQLKVGGLMAKKYLGGKTPAKTPGEAANNTAAALRALAARKGSMSDRAYDEARNKIIHGGN